MTIRKRYIGALWTIGVVALLATGLSSVGSVEAAIRVKNSERFKLWNDCRPVSFIVHLSNSPESNVSVELMSIVDSVRSRLKAAGLHSVDAHEKIHIFVRVKKEILRVTTTFLKPVHDEATLERGHAATWDLQFTGLHRGNRDVVLAAPPFFTDEFIKEYRRVNASACQR